MSNATAQAADRAQTGEQTSARLLEIALDLFAEKGFDATSLQEIADRLGVTKAALYYHYRSKAEILEAIFAIAHRRADEFLERAEQQRSHPARVAVVVEGIAELAVQQRRTAAVLEHDPALARNSALMAQITAQRSRLQELIYGPTPTPTQRAAFQLTTCLRYAVGQLDDLTDDELRQTLPALIYRTLGLRRPATGSPTRPSAGTDPTR